MNFIINNSKLKGAIIGFGKLGLLHLAQFNSHPDVEIVAICENEKILCNIIKKNFTDFLVTDDYKELIKENLDFVAVCTPTDKHFEIIEFFLHNKLPVFSEKPLARNLDEAVILQKLSNINNTLLYAGYMYEFYETFNKAFDLIINKKIIGNLIYSKNEMYVSQLLKKPKKTNWRFIKKKSGGGVLITQTSHLIYLALKFFGKHKKCHSFTKKIFSEENEDYSHIMLKFDNDLICSIDASWSVLNYRTPFLKMFIEGSEGTISITEDKIELFLSEDKLGYSKGMNKISKLELFENTYYNVAGTHYAHQANYFINLLKNKEVDSEKLTLSVDTNRIIQEVYNNE
jgi:predicted dehydrogenase